MKCPLDDTVLQMTERQGIEIDYCPQCRGVWLDRGELDKLIDRSLAVGGASPAASAPAAGSVPPAPPQSSRSQYPSYEQPRHDPRHDPRHEDRYYRKRRKESFLGDLFDF